MFIGTDRPTGPLGCLVWQAFCTGLFIDRGKRGFL